MTDSTTTLLLARHGHVEGIQPRRFRGRAELALTALGRRQARALCARIAWQWRPDVICASPLRRCMDTATAIAQPTQVRPRAVPELVDIDYGKWQGLTEQQARQGWPDAWACWHDTPARAAIPGGESLPELWYRSVLALHRLLDAQAGHTLVIVAHDSVNRALLLHALDLPLSRYNTIAQSPGGLNVLAFEHGRFTIETINETGHLPDP